MSGGLYFTVYGIPKPQGSGKLIKAKSGAIFKKTEATHAQWRNALMEKIAREIEVLRGAGQWEGPLSGAVSLSVTFYFPRPKSHPKWRQALPWHTSAPDLDKLVRAVGDALQGAGAISDDSKINTISATKLYVGVSHPEPGATVSLVEHHPMVREG